MGGFGIWHWLIVIILVMLLFGKGRVSDMMGDIGKGLKSFKAGMSEEDEAKQQQQQQRPAEPRQIPPQQPPIDITPRAADPAAPPPPPCDDNAR